MTQGPQGAQRPIWLLVDKFNQFETKLLALVEESGVIFAALDEADQFRLGIGPTPHRLGILPRQCGPNFGVSMQDPANALMEKDP